MNLVIVSHVAHYEWRGHLYAFGPYAREIDIWADLFDQVTIAAPFFRQEPPAECLAFTRSNIRVEPQREAGGASCGAKIRLALSTPAMVFDLCKALRGADAIHVRCPGNLGLLGAILAPLFSRRLIAKYAGQWAGYPGEELTVRMQRAILRSRWWRGPVTVYGRWPGEPPHVIPFFTSILTDEQVERGRRAAAARRPGPVPRVLFLGRLSAAKNVDVLLAAIARLSSRGIRMQARIAGDGPMRPALEKQARDQGIERLVEFSGAIEYDRVLEALEQSDILVLASETEGWPKAIAEGMAYGLVCVGTDRGWVPEMLAGGRGLVVPPGNLDALTDTLARIAADPSRYQETTRLAREWAAGYSLEGLRAALRQLMLERWDVPAQAFPAVAPSRVVLSSRIAPTQG